MSPTAPARPPPRAGNLSLRQREILTYLIETTRTTGIQPSMRDMGDAFGMASANAIHNHMKAIEKKGWITLPHHPRSGIRSPARSIRILKNLDGSPFHGWK